MELTKGSSGMGTSLMDMGLNARLSAETVSAKSWTAGGTASLFQSYGGIYHSTPLTYFHTHDTFKQAFKVVSLMIEKGYLKNITLRKFIQIVAEVEDEL